MKRKYYLAWVLLSCLFSRHAEAQATATNTAEQDSLIKTASAKELSPAKVKTVNSPPTQLTPPMIIAAIPYHGALTAIDGNHPEIEIAPDTSFFHFLANFSEMNRPLYTYDSSEVYFVSPDINRSNASQYQYRLLLNGKTVAQPWQAISNFADTLFGKNNFQKGMAFFGAYKTSWNNYLQIEIKRKDMDRLLSSAMVYWKPIKPALLDIYRADELDSLLARLQKLTGNPVTNEDLILPAGRQTTAALNKWKRWYQPDELDSSTGLPRKLILKAAEGNIIFYLQGDFHIQEELEYQIMKGNKVYSPWKTNDTHNNFIWLKNLEPGEYELQMRFRLQRHNITSYPIYIKQEWFQTAWFKIGVAAMAALILFLLFILRKQKEKLKNEKTKKERLDLELKALRSQLNPHFVSNALSSIIVLISKNDLKSATLYLVEFSRLMRQALESENEYVPLEEELKIIIHYFKLEQLRFGFQFFISVAPGLNHVSIPSLLIQPLIENAVKHGAGPKHASGMVDLRFSANDKDLLIDIADNGEGFVNDEANYGFGLRLVHDRIRVLNTGLRGKQIHLTISNENDLTTALLTFKNWL
ncbi:MAG: putative signal transduction histidine kinase [Chitinophagaceae bacterium]|nr:putative signal transduction histidine kinase [Chitinophagaceae bacterium]